MKKHNSKQQHLKGIPKEDDFIDFRVKPTKPKMKNHIEPSTTKQVLKKNPEKTHNWSKENTHFDCDESLRDLKNGKQNQLNEKIKLLKLELNSILEGSTSLENESLSNSSCKDQESLSISKICSPVKFSSTTKSSKDRSETNSEYSTIKDTFSVTSSTPLKDSSIENHDQRVKSFGCKFSQIKKISESESLSDEGSYNEDCKNFKEGVPSSSKTPKLKYDMSKVSQNKLEKLVYKSFLLQNLCQQSSADENEGNAHASKSFFRRRKAFAKQNELQKGKRNKNAVKPNTRKRKQSSKPRSRKKVQVVNLLQDSTSDSINNFSDEISVCNEPICISSSDEDFFNCIDLENFDKSDSVLFVNDQSLREGTDSCSEIESDKMSQDCEKGKQSLNLSSSQIWECPICLEPSKGQEIVTTSCGHIFCKECIQNYHSKSSKTCPFCREDLCDKTLIPLCDLN